MIVYLDASALVKRYVAEAGSAEVGGLIDQAEAAGTSIISRAEVAAALAKAVRMRLLPRDEAASALEVFSRDWESLVRLQLTEVLVSRAASLAWNHGLRGYDAAHLASTLFWQDMLGAPVTVASYDRQLWEAAQANGLIAWPKSLP
jgi:predicted nucleic acid-binding protein